MSISNITLANTFKYLIAINGAIILYLFGNITALMELLVGVICLDFITGLLKAKKQKKLNSTIGRNGVYRKLGIGLGVVFAHFIDLYLESGNLFRDLIINFFIVTEFISISENLLALGIIMPKFIKDFLENSIDSKKYK